MRLERGPDHLSQLSLDMLVLGALAAADEASARRHLDACATCREQYEALRSAAEHFDRHVSPRTADNVARVLGARARKPRPRTAWWLATGLAAALAGAAIVLAPEVHVDRDTRLLVKGSPSFAVFARHGEHVFVVDDGTHLAAGDSLRFTASPSEYSYILIASIDAAPHATVYFPYGGAQSAKLEPQRRFEDDSGVVLDEALGPERIFALFSRQPLSSKDVLEKLLEMGKQGPDGIRSARPLGVPADFQTSLLIEK